MNFEQRKSISFTPKHKLEDAEQEYIEAVYRFRRAEEEQSAEYGSTKREMFRLEANLATVREHIYRGTTYGLFESPKAKVEFIRYPIPTWL